MPAENSKAAKDEYLLMLKSNDPEQRAEAAESLGKVKDFQIVEDLVNALHDDYWKVRARAIWALGRLNPPELTAYLTPLTSDTHLTVRSQALLELANSPDENNLGLFLHSIRTDNYAISAAAASGIARLPNKLVAVSDLLELIKSKKLNTRRAALLALTELEAVKAVEPVIELLADKNYVIRHEAVYALQVLGDKRAVKPLIKLLDDKYYAVRYQAVYALGLLGDMSSRPALETLLQRTKRNSAASRRNLLLGATILEAIRMIDKTQTI